MWGGGEIKEKIKNKTIYNPYKISMLYCFLIKHYIRKICSPEITIYICMKPKSYSHSRA